ncbi:MAG: 50S ribosomal protein L18e [Candidatus Aenigmarchaeota archaeon]|nr:50S ribosomal protein L18e [Candidatus Aenigmarchaeota archaeon]
MTKKTGPTNEHTKQLIVDLYTASEKGKIKIWKDVAERIQKPSRIIPSVNLSKIEKYAKEKEIILIPGKLLGDGILTKKVTVSSLKASKTAIEKLTACGGKYITIKELIKTNPKGKTTRIMA